MAHELDRAALGSNPTDHSRLVLFIYDFDDTIYPRSHPATEQKDLDSFQNTVFELLSRSQDKGKVYIVTNAKKAWVEDTIRTYIPKLDSLPLIIVSARDLFGHENEADLEDFILWKTLAIHEVLSLERTQMTLSQEVHLISIGDSSVERSAAMAATRDDARAICKTVKLARQPTFGLLKKELEVLTHELNNITEYHSKLDLAIAEVY